MVGTATARLAAQVGRMTASRRAVVGAVARQKGHFTAEALAASLPEVGRATVYRTLKLLTDSGVLCRVMMEDGSLHYRLSGPEHHHHLVCTGCGSIRDFAEPRIERVVASLARASDYSVESHWLEIYGRCASCRASSTTR